MVNHFDAALEKREFKVVEMPFPLYCARFTCNTLIPEGMKAQRYDYSTYTHVNCPVSEKRTFAAHKQPDTGMTIDGR